MVVTQGVSGGQPDDVVVEADVEVDVASLLSLLGDRVDGEVLQALAGTGLRQVHGYLVQRLLRGPATATEIALDLGVSQQAVSKALKEMADLGHVEPVQDPADRRRRPVRLSATGRRAVVAARAARAAVDARLGEHLGPERFEALRSALVLSADALGLGERVRRRTVTPPGGVLEG